MDLLVKVSAAAAVAAALGACAPLSEPGTNLQRDEAAPPPGRVQLTNTTDRCLAPVALTLRLGDEVLGTVAPGGSHGFEVPPGPASLTVAPHKAHRGPEQWGIEVLSGQTAQLWHGCAAPEFLKPADGRVRVRLVNHAHACQRGPHGIARWSLDGIPVAELPPGQSVERWLPSGAHRLQTSVAGRGGEQERVELASGAELAVGCDARPRAGGALVPLTLLNRPDGCEALQVEAAGQRLHLEPGAAHTLLLPRGDHLVRFRTAGGEPFGELERVRLENAGRVLERSRCIEAAADGR